MWQLLRGLLLYNTVYWQKASDGLRMPSLSAADRERQRPVRDLEVIRPRENPRAKLADGGEAPTRRSKGKEVRLGTFRRAEEVPPAMPAEPNTPAAETGGDGKTYVKRRRYRRRFFGGA